MRTAFAFLLLFTALSLSAADTPPNYEVCRFRALDAENPFRRWLASDEVTCFSAGSPPSLPEGQWNVFARAAGAVSSSPLLVDGYADPASVRPELRPGATLIPLLPDKHRGVIYVPRRASALPIDAARVTVPADEPLWLFVLDGSRPVAVIPIAPLAAKTERQVDARSGAASSEPPSLVGWVQMPERDRVAIAPTSNLVVPAIRAGSHDADPLPPLSMLHGAFFRIDEVPSGTAAVELSGRGWLRDRRVMKVEPGLNVAAAPLLARASGTLTVHWSSESDLRELDRSIGACNAAEEPPRVTITIFRCPSLPSGERFDAAACAQLRQEKSDLQMGSVTLDDLVPGTYRAEMSFGKLPPISATTTVATAAVTDLRLVARYFTLYGSVTRGGKPLGEDASIHLNGGVGFVAAESDEYRALFQTGGERGESRFTVTACDGAPSGVVLTDRPVRPNARVDIDIPVNELAVRVTDTFTHDRLAGATVELEVMSRFLPNRVVFSTTKKADPGGNVLWQSVPVRSVRLTVHHDGYEKRIVETFSMPASGRHDVDVQLVPLRGSRGKIVSDRPFARATVMWFKPDGTLSEQVDVAQDGTFVHANTHTPDETMTVVSASHPLWVTRAPAATGRENLVVAFPAAPPVAFNVWLEGAGASEMRYVGVIIGGLRVPQPALAEHHDLRRTPPLLRGAGPQHFVDLLGTGAIEILLGPKDSEVTGRMRGMDLFALPQFAGSPRKRHEPGSTDVVFQSK